jgi:uncharacterized protein YbjT (DUF2867 family)
MQLEWIKQLSKDSKNFVIAVVRNPSKAEALKPLLGSNVAVVKADLSDFDSFPVSSLGCWKEMAVTNL